MSENPTKWSRKRSSNEDDYDRSSSIRDEQPPKNTDWKVKTLDEIRQEKRRRLDNESPMDEREGSRLSGRSSGASSPSLKIESRSPSNRPSPAITPAQEIIYQLSPDHNSPLSTGSDGSTKKRPLQNKDRRRTEEEEGEILSDISDDETGTKQKSRGNSRRTSVDVEMATKPTVDEVQQGMEEESSDEESESSEEEAEEETKAEKGKDVVSGTTQDKEESESSEEDESSDSDSDDSEESSEEDDEEEEEDKEEKKEQQAENKPGNETEGNQEDSDDDDDDSEDDSDDSDSEDSDNSDSSEEEEEVTAKEVKQKQDPKTVKNIEDNKDVNTSPDSRKQLEKDRRQRNTSEHRSKSREKYVRHPMDSGSRSRHDYEEPRRQDHNRQKPKHLKDGRDDQISKEKSRERSERQSKGEKMSSEKGKHSRSTKNRNEVNESNRNKSDDRDSHKRKRREGKSSISNDESRSSRKEVASKTSNAYETRTKETTSETKNSKLQTMSRVLTEKERLQFSTEVVDSESDHESSEEDLSDSEREKAELNETQKNEKEEKPIKKPDYLPGIQGCRNVSEEFVWLNRIEEGTYGVVYRARDKRTNEIVALKRLKMEKEKEGFPITSLREINTLLKGQHPNIVTVREIVVGNNMDKIYIVMDYVEHDLKTLMEHMSSKFSVGEVKSLLVQLLRAVAHLHDNWILHRDLKTSNLLLSNEGILKVGDFGLAREYGSPLRHYTPIVVTLWYRAPELLLGIKEYSCPIDLWSVGCIFAELLTMKPLFPGKSEIDQINRIFKELGTPSDAIWPGPPKYSELPHVKKMTFTEYPYNQLRNNFGTYLTDKGFDLLNRFLTYDPNRRITAEEALQHEYFNESPLPVDPDMFPTWPAKSEMMQRPRRKDYEHSPKAPEGGEMFSKLKDGSDSSSAAAAGGGVQGFHMPSSKKGSAAVAGFSLKF